MVRRRGILVAGIGNIFLGDDGFGVEVAQRLARRDLPSDVRVVDYGIRGFDLAFALLEPYETAILVDAAPLGELPGTLAVIEPDLEELGAWGAAAPSVQGHSLDPASVLRLVAAMGGEPPHILLVGCEPATLGEEQEGAIGLSEPVQAAVEEAVALVESLVGQMRAAPGAREAGSARRIS